MATQPPTSYPTLLRDGRVARVDVHGGPDGQGCYHYTLSFVAGYTPGHPDGEYVRRERGQAFHGPLPEPIDSAAGDTQTASPRGEGVAEQLIVGVAL